MSTIAIISVPLDVSVVIGMSIHFDKVLYKASPWRNGLAHWTSNSKVVGSSPTGDVVFSLFFR